MAKQYFCDICGQQVDVTAVHRIEVEGDTSYIAGNDTLEVETCQPCYREKIVAIMELLTSNDDGTDDA